MQQQYCIIELGRPQLHLLWSITLAQRLGAYRSCKTFFASDCLFDKGYHFARYIKLLGANLGLTPEIHDKVRGKTDGFFFFFFRASLFLLEKIGICYFHQTFANFLVVKTQCFCLFRVLY